MPRDESIRRIGPFLKTLTGNNTIRARNLYSENDGDPMIIRKITGNPNPCLIIDKILDQSSWRDLKYRLLP